MDSDVRLGAQILSPINREEIIPHINKKVLYRISWGAQKARGSKWEAVQKELNEKYEEMLQELRKDPWIEPKAGYGHWYASAENDTILIHHPKEPQHIIARFPLPRQPVEDGLCLSDYLPAQAQKETGLISFQVVTVGKYATQKINSLFEEGNYVEGYFAHGLAAQFAEATADYVHARIRAELGLKKNQSRRYSWGYEPIPDLAQHKTLFELIPAREKLGMDLTSANQLIPEQSTAAMVIHHEQARYFRIRIKGT